MWGKDIQFALIRLQQVDNFERLFAKFDCENVMLNYYLGCQAREDTEHTTYLIIDQKQKLLIGYVSFQCSGMMTMTRDSKHWRLTSPAIQISYFALDSRYHHLLFDSKIPHFYLSDAIFRTIFALLQNIARETIAAHYIVAYSLPDAEKFYRRRGFRSFDEYTGMIAHTDQTKKAVADESIFIRECIPMYLPID